LTGFLVGNHLNKAEGAGASETPRMIASPDCSKCGRYATLAERDASSICPGCGEPLPYVPRKPAMPELLSAPGARSD
jgi:hypothetical protein